MVSICTKVRIGLIAHHISHLMTVRLLRKQFPDRDAIPFVQSWLNCTVSWLWIKTGEKINESILRTNWLHGICNK